MAPPGYRTPAIRRPSRLVVGRATPTPFAPTLAAMLTTDTTDTHDDLQGVLLETLNLVRLGLAGLRNRHDDPAAAVVQIEALLEVLAERLQGVAGAF